LLGWVEILKGRFGFGFGKTNLEEENTSYQILQDIILKGEYLVLSIIENQMEAKRILIG
jgi:hypothetical protein